MTTDKNFGYAVYRQNSPYGSLAISPILKSKEAAEEIAQRINRLVMTDKDAAIALLQQDDPMAFVKKHEVIGFTRSNGEKDYVMGGAQDL